MRKLTFLGLGIALLLGTFWYQSRNDSQEAKTPEQLRAEEIAFRTERRKNGYVKQDKPHKLWEYFELITTPADGKKLDYPVGYQLAELEKAKENWAKARIENDSISFRERGPANVPGRTRVLVIDPEDQSNRTWWACAVSGGIWRTTDEGKNWTKTTLDLPNLATVSMTISPKNPQVIYVGTGEGFGGVGMVRGDGIFKSNDKGKTWQHLSATRGNADFAFVNRIITHPQDENIVVAVTNTGIQKTQDGGNTWQKVYTSSQRVQDVVFEKDNFNVQYAGVNGYGIIKSTDAGSTWRDASNGITQGARFEVAVSPTRPQRVYASAEIDETTSILYISDDGGQNWQRSQEMNAANVNYMDGQGWFDNCIAVHPYDHKIIYVGGVNLWKVEAQDDIVTGTPTVSSVRENGTEVFMDFVRVTGFPLWSGRLSVGDDTSKNTSIQLRFGKDKKQKALRFTVPTGATSGVPAANYTYRDYVDIPFEAWDITNNRQLMVSFRDQDQDGVFNLIARNDAAGILGREYIYIHSVPYDAEKPSELLSKNGGHEIQLMYSLWPTLQPTFTWNPNDLPESNLQINWGNVNSRMVKTTNLTDAYEKYSKQNTLTQYHPDQHGIYLLPISESNKTFRMITTNDGGVYYSDNEGLFFNKVGNTMNTTQFYAVDKRTGAEDYIGGAQDNGTWKSPRDGKANAQSLYLEMTGGDGFGVVWHSRNPDRIMTSSQFNNLYRTTNHGANWSKAVSGLTQAGNQRNSGFITRLASSRNNPDVVFAVSRAGVWKTTNFGESWRNITIGDGWVYRATFNVPDSSGSVGSINIAVSLADAQTVWAGSGMTEATRLFVSTNNGESFRAVQNFTQTTMGALSGLTTHPTEAKTAYALFSMRGKPKIVRTRDLGQTWEDISGFGTNNVSSSGFPDVAVFSLLVFPKPEGKIWAGTEIGIFESNDNGRTWNFRKDFPSVSVWDLKLIDNQVVIGTHGRGIWTAELPKSMHITGLRDDIVYHKLQIYPNPASSKVVLDLPLGTTYKINIYNMEGKNVLETQKTGGKTEIILDRLPKGFYNIVASSPKGNFSQKLIIE